MKYILILTTILFAQGSLAQNANDLFNQRLLDRLDRVEKDLNFIEEQFYRQDNSSQSLTKRQMRTQPKLEVRITALEEQIRLLYGQIEERDFALRSIESKLDKMIIDVDFRLSNIESNKPANLNNVNNIADEHEKQPQRLIGKLENTTKESTAPLDTMGQYDKAFEFLREADYEKAEYSLRDFIAGNQESELVSNAYYWLGETYFVREDYEKSAVNFLKGYQQKPQGNKAADNLLKLGMSLDKLNKKKEACTTFAKLSKEFPDADKDIKDKTESETKRIGCS